jgi:bisphosphoglycerate-dependent phosphoglycerate mutase
MDDVVTFRWMAKELAERNAEARLLAACVELTSDQLDTVFTALLVYADGEMKYAATCGEKTHMTMPVDYYARFRNRDYAETMAERLAERWKERGFPCQLIGGRSKPSVLVAWHWELEQAQALRNRR